jgi:hypothetical protein
MAKLLSKTKGGTIVRGNPVPKYLLELIETLKRISER